MSTQLREKRNLIAFILLCGLPPLALQLFCCFVLLLFFVLDLPFFCCLVQIFHLLSLLFICLKTLTALLFFLVPALVLGSPAVLLLCPSLGPAPPQLISTTLKTFKKTLFNMALRLH